MQSKCARSSSTAENSPRSLLSSDKTLPSLASTGITQSNQRQCGTHGRHFTTRSLRGRVLEMYLYFDIVCPGCCPVYCCTRANDGLVDNSPTITKVCPVSNAGLTLALLKNSEDV